VDRPFGGWSLDSTIQGPWPLPGGPSGFWFPMTSSQRSRHGHQLVDVRAGPGPGRHQLPRGGQAGRVRAPARGRAARRRPRATSTTTGGPTCCGATRPATATCLDHERAAATTASWISPDPSGPQWQVVARTTSTWTAAATCCSPTPRPARSSSGHEGATRNGPAYVMTGAHAPGPALARGRHGPTSTATASPTWSIATAPPRRSRSGRSTART